jgi:hypothetical protein
VRAVRDAAQAPVQVSALADMLALAFSGTGDKSARMLADVVRLGFLITSLRPPMTTTDSLGHVTAELRAAGAHEIPETEGLLEQLEALHGELAAHNAAGPERQATMRERLSVTVTEISAEGRTPLCLDLRLDAEVTLPEPVGLEMAATASALIRLSPGPGGSPVWEDYHRRFTDRFGAGTLVPLLDVVDPRDRPGLPGRVPGQRPAAAAGAGRRQARAPGPADHGRERGHADRRADRRDDGKPVRPPARPRTSMRSSWWRRSCALTRWSTLEAAVRAEPSASRSRRSARSP